MSYIRQQFIVDEQGNRVAVVLDMSEYTRILEDLEELDAIRAYDRAKASGEDFIPFEEAIADLEKRP